MTRPATLATGLVTLALAGCAAPAGPVANTEGLAQPVADWQLKIAAANEALLNRGEIDRVPEFFAEAYVSHVPEGDARGRESIRTFIAAMRTAFPDLVVEIEVLVASDDRVAWRRTHRGTHQGDFMGIAATGRVLEWQSMVVTRYEDGLIAEEWGVTNLGAVIRTP